MANTVDPEQTSRSVASNLGLHSLLRPVYEICKVSTVHQFYHLRNFKTP